MDPSQAINALLGDQLASILDGPTDTTLLLTYMRRKAYDDQNEALAVLARYDSKTCLHKQLV